MLLVFDVDGTIMDSWNEIKIVFTMVFERRGIPLSDDALRMSVGLPLDKVVEKLIGKEDPRMVDEIRKEFFALKPRRIRMYPGMKDILQLPIKKAILTSKGKVGTLRDLKYLNILDRFEVIMDADSVVRKKPDPEGLLRIMSALGERREHTYMIGDTEMDILAAKNAGVKSVAVTWGYRSEDFLKKYNPDYIVSSPTQLKEMFASHAHL